MLGIDVVMEIVKMFSGYEFSPAASLSEYLPQIKK